MRFLINSMVSLSVSVALLGVLAHLILSATEPSAWSRLVATLSSFPAIYLVGYLAAALLRSCIQAQRYRLLLRPTEKTIPSFSHLLLVTMSRNMFVDMLPARLGELSYIAMLNRGYRVSGQGCLSSLAIGFVFDLIALACLILVLIVAQLAGGALQGWMLVVLFMLVMVVGTILVCLYPLLAAINRWAVKVAVLQRGLFGRVLVFSERFQQALFDTRSAGIVKPVFLLSLGIRGLKYLGLYCLFVGVVIETYPEMTTRIVHVTAALISAEAGASLPIPAFMSFGTYEAAGVLALVALGANSATSLIVMLAMHVISQTVDYALGVVGLVVFYLTTSARFIKPRLLGRKKGWLLFLLSLLGLACAVAFLVYEMRSVSKRGSLRPPDRGEAVRPISAISDEAMQHLDGFVVWSSNRSGNHDLYLLRFPGQQIERITSHPHTETYPRISPNGKQVVFARGHQEWVSQRNLHAWDVVLLDLLTREERIVARNGYVPTWSSDGRRIFFQRQGNQVVEVDVASGRERVLYRSGETVDVPADTILETPSISSLDDQMAVTLRGPVRATALVDRTGTVRKLGNGCQLNWGPGDHYLYTIDHGGKMQNALYRVDAQTLKSEKWFDSPSEFSHEYFPRVANTADVLVYGASRGGHEHDTADYEIFLWIIGQSPDQAIRLTHHTGNDCWPDVFLRRPAGQLP